MDYVRKIKRFLVKTNMSKHKFCELSGFSKDQVNNFIYGKQNITPEYKLQLDEFFSVESHWVWNEKAPSERVKKDLDKGVRTCVRCKEIKSFVRMRNTGHVYHVDEDNFRWNGKVCYQCFKVQARSRYRDKMDVKNEKYRRKTG